MNRFKKHKVKREKLEPSGSHSREVEEHDLAYYIHDRVELMHQIFSVLKHKELRAMAPECVRRISIDDLQELCTEELLGISSKRLCAILDGAEPPSDTESSSQSEPERLETISLDSISSDEEILSQTSSRKKKHKHRRRDSKAKKKRTKSKEPDPAEDAEESKASRAGLTVLELLELQARARAIRAQLQQEQAKKQAAEPAPAVVHESSASENEVEIKEETPEVVEISSDEEKPKIEELEKALPKANDDANKNGVEAEATDKNCEKDKEANKSKEKKSKKDKSKKDKKKEKENKNKDLEKEKKKDSQKDTKKDSEKDDNDLRKKIEKSKNKSPEVSKEIENTQKITKKINDLIITVPQHHSRKIKLNRNKVTVSVSNTESVASTVNSNRTVSVMSPEKTSDEIRNHTQTTVKSRLHVAIKPKDKEKLKDKSKKKHKKKERKKSSDKDASDHDEITLQLSDSEKMDLLEDFDRRNLDNVTSCSEDSDSSSDSDSDTSQDSSKENTFETPQSMPVEKVDGNCGNSEDHEEDLDKNDKNTEIESEEDKNITQDLEDTTNKEVLIQTEDSYSPANVVEKETHDNTSEKQSETQVESGNDSQTSCSYYTTTKVKNVTLNRIESYVSSNGTENNLIINDINDIPVRKDIPESQDNIRDKESTVVIDIEKISSETVSNPTENVQENKETTVKSSHSSDKIENPAEILENETSVEPPQIDIVEISSKTKTPTKNIQEKKETKLKSSQLSDKIENPAENLENEAAVEPSQMVVQSDSKNDHHEITLRSNEIDNGMQNNNTTQDSSTNNLSEGEVSSNESTEVEACELKPEVVCISDEEAESIEGPKKKKNKKKEKKSKKEKKAKKLKSDFREGADQNFYRDIEIHVIDEKDDTKLSSDSKEYDSVIDNDDDVYEILELSDDSSCYEVEGTVLSKEPTAKEIEALSAKIDEIEREEVITDEQIREHEKKLMDKRTNNENTIENEENSEDNLENISWKDRYLGSKKVKTVLTTSNILNALRKKNRELKNKLEESKKKEEEPAPEQTEIPEESTELEEGSIEHYNTLQGSTKYVDPVPDDTDNKEIDGSTKTPEDTIIDKNNIEIQVTGEMKKDAKQLLKMYKKLLKYNDMTKPKDPNKKQKKKQKHKEKDVGNVASSEVVN